MTEKRSYGLCPTQLDGYSADGRPFYFRSRSGSWTIELGEKGWPANICAWPSGFRENLIASGPGDVNDPDAVDALVDEHVGRGWREATYGEQQFESECRDCSRRFTTLGGTICGDCLHALIRGDR